MALGKAWLSRLVNAVEPKLLCPSGHKRRQITWMLRKNGRDEAVLAALLQFFRSRLADWIYCSRSGLEGEQWSAPKPSLLPNNNISILALRLRSGRRAMIYNRYLQEAEIFGVVPALEIA